MSLHKTYDHASGLQNVAPPSSALLNSTKEVPCVVPKPEPLIVITENVPAVIVVGENPVIAATA